jgi:predicted DNA-binding transcriptional regulator YafY
MRLEKSVLIIRLARRMAGSADGVSLEEIAQDFAVDRRTAERMRDAVRELFPQVEEIRDGRSKRFVLRGGLDPFMDVPTAEELADLALSAKAAEQEGLTSRAENLRTLASRVESRLKSDLRRRLAPDVEALAMAERIALRPGPRPGDHDAVLRGLRQALLSMQRVSFDYPLADGEGNARRVVDPCGLLFGAVYYLVGRQIDRPNAVLWRLDRISGVRLEAATASLPAGFDLAAYAERTFGVFQEEPEDIVLRAQPEVAERALAYRFHQHQRLEPQNDGSVLIHMRVGGLLELCWHLVTWRGDIAIEAPSRLKVMFRSELARLSSVAID